jgi:hypothetical protein
MIQSHSVLGAAALDHPRFKYAQIRPRRQLRVAMGMDGRSNRR